MFAAGTGVLWLCRRRLGFGLAAALAAGARVPAVPVPPALRLADVGDAAAVGRAGLAGRPDDRRGHSDPVARRRAGRPGRRQHRRGQRDRARDDDPRPAAVAARRRGRAARWRGGGPSPRPLRIGVLAIGVSLWWMAMLCDPGPAGRRRPLLLRVAGGRQLHVDLDRGVARARLLADVHPRPVRRDHDGRAPTT